jgi:carbon monoxide dehydrogenase subunit G
MVRKVLAVSGVVVALSVAFVASRPSAFAVERSTSVDAPPAVVYGLIQDFHVWESWSPWAKLDPAMKTTYGGPEVGVGATYAWEGNNEVGAGKMTIADAKPNEAVGITLDFLRPIAATNRTDFLLTPEGRGTKVTWHMSGHNGFVGKAFGLFMDMDKMVGKDFEKGLAQLKPLAEGAAKKAATAPVAPPAGAGRAAVADAAP